MTDFTPKFKTRFYVTKLSIEDFIAPTFDSQEEAEAWVNKYIDDLSERDEAMGISWDSVNWDIVPSIEEID
jgi:hypothetical protein